MDVEKLELSYIAEGNVNGTFTLGNTLVGHSSKS